MAKESYNQSSIMGKIESIGGHVINGVYTRAGEADLQCGYPISIGNEPVEINGPLMPIMILAHLCVETKTEKDYYRVMSALEEVDGQYKIIDIKKLKKHEPLQVAKVNAVRRKHGMALFAYCFEQVEEYVRSIHGN